MASTSQTQMEASSSKGQIEASSSKGQIEASSSKGQIEASSSKGQMQPSSSKQMMQEPSSVGGRQPSPLPQGREPQPQEVDPSGKQAAPRYNLNNQIEDLTLRTGLHYKTPARTYGEVCDERDKDSLDPSDIVGKYKCGAFLHHCNEDRKEDNQYSPISQYKHLCRTKVGPKVGPRIGNPRTCTYNCNCDKRRAIVQYMTVIPKGYYPGHQPAFDVDMLRTCVPKPLVCLEHDVRDACKTQYEKQGRIDRASRPSVLLAHHPLHHVS